MNLEAILTNTPINLDIASLVLRIMLGIIFLVHGYPKIAHMGRTAGFLGSLGFKPGIFWAFLLAVTEFGGALALISGFYIRIFCILLTGSMLVATSLKAFAWKTGFQGEKGTGYEFDLIIIASIIALFLLGAGSLTLF